MTEKKICPQCESLQQCEIVSKKESVTIKEREISFDAVLTRCTSCGVEFEIPGQLDANLLAAREAYDRLYGSPTPEEIIALRSRYNASQKAFGTILGFGELTINSYEQGQTPDSTNRLLLRLAEDPAIFKAMYNINRDRLGAVQRRRIESSEGFTKANSWAGMGAISENLTVQQREMVELRANRKQQTVMNQTADYIQKGVLQDYTKLMEKADWTSGVSTESDEIEKAMTSLDGGFDAA